MLTEGGVQALIQAALCERLGLDPGWHGVRVMRRLVRIVRGVDVHALIIDLMIRIRPAGPYTVLVFLHSLCTG